MGITENFGHLSKGTEFCQGFKDKHGQWNNGFHCPIWGPTDRHYCCGTAEHKYCCPKPDPHEEITTTHSGTTQGPLVAGLVVGFVVLFGLIITAACYLCHCCLGYRKRKRVSPPVTAGIAQNAIFRRSHSSAPSTIAFSSLPSSHSNRLADLMAFGFPMGDPPPYPGAIGHSSLKETKPCKKSGNGYLSGGGLVVAMQPDVSKHGSRQPLWMSSDEYGASIASASSSYRHGDVAAEHVTAASYGCGPPPEVDYTTGGIHNEGINNSGAAFMVLPHLAGMFHSRISVSSSSSSSSSSEGSLVALTTTSACLLGETGSSSSQDSVDIQLDSHGAKYRRLHFTNSDVQTDNINWGCSTL